MEPCAPSVPKVKLGHTVGFVGPLGSWALGQLGQLSNWAVVALGQLSYRAVVYLGSCLKRAVVALGQLSHGAVVYPGNCRMSSFHQRQLSPGKMSAHQYCYSSEVIQLIPKNKES